MRRLFGLLALVAVSLSGFLLTHESGQSAPDSDNARSVTMTCSQPVLDVGTGAQVSIGGVPWYAESGQIVLAHEWNGDQYYTFGGRRYLYIGSVSAPAKFFIVEECGQPPAAAAPPAPSLSRLADDTYVYQHSGYTTFFVVTDEGVIVGDPMGPTRSPSLKAAIASVTSQPVRYMVYSHHDQDHNRGGGVFSDTATYVAHANAVEPIAQRNDPNSPVPTMTFQDRMTLRLGHAELQLTYLGLNHSESTIVVQYPARRIAWMVDIVPTNSVIFGPRQNGDYVQDWIASLRKVEALDFDTLIPGHGDPSPKVWATWTREYIQDLIRAIEFAERSGHAAKSPSMYDFVRAQLFNQYGSWNNFGPRIPVHVNGIYDNWEKLGRFSVN